MDFPHRAANEPYVFIDGVAQEVVCDVTNVVPVPSVRFLLDDVDMSEGIALNSTKSVSLQIK